jgi:hypothetical protein
VRGERRDEQGSERAPRGARRSARPRGVSEDDDDFGVLEPPPNSFSEIDTSANNSRNRRADTSGHQTEKPTQPGDSA